MLLPKNNPVILVPAPTVATWATLQNSNSLAIPTGSGSIAMQFYYDNLPAAGVAVTTEPASATPPIYDSTSSATIWGTAQTSSAGVTIIAGLAESIGTQGVTVNETSNINDLAFGPISVFADSITFVGGPITAP